MKKACGVFRLILIASAILFAVPSLTSAQGSFVPSRITSAVDESNLTTLRGNTHPLALPQSDRGSAPPSLPMERMLLVLKRSAAQEAALDALLDQQQDSSSSNYHRWLSPDDFGQQFGPSDQDIQAIASWLQSHGFQIASVSRGRTTIEFSGTASQVQEAFHTSVHKYSVDGEDHWANSTDPQIPTALAPVVAGINTLHNFPREAMHHIAGLASRSRATGRVTLAQTPHYTLGGECGVPGVGCHAVGPFDFATIYNLLPLWTAAPTHIDGTGQTIAIVGESNIDVQDVAAFRTYFGLSSPNLQVILDGPDPGIVQPDETESDLDVEWAGAAAPSATIDFVTSQSTNASVGVDLSAEYVVDNNLAPILSESYGECELFLGSAGNQFYYSLWQQAAAQGITVLVATGDSGSAVCDRDAGTQGAAQYGLSVSGISSTPYNVAVGGTDFNDLASPSTYWAAANSAPPPPGNPSALATVSALSYIPETTWNDTCTNSVFGVLLGYSMNAETNCNNSQLIKDGFLDPVGGSGGKSNCTNSNGQNVLSCTGGYLKPSWQTGGGVPVDARRDVPDVSLYAAINSPSGSFYVVCEKDFNPSMVSCDPTNPNTSFLAIGGTSASTPALAGIIALVNQETQSRQGNANYVLYKLAAQQPTAFNDVLPGGTIAMPCVTGSTSDCTTSFAGDKYGVLSGFSTGLNYDLATGLGSVNANILVTNWSTVTSGSKGTLTSLAISPVMSPIPHGTAVAISIAVSPNPASSGTPTGQVSLIASTGESAGSFTLGSNGSLSPGATTNLLPGGSYTVTAHYAGDGIFAPSDSTPPVAVTVAPEASKIQLALELFDPVTGAVANPNATTMAYGELSALHVSVTSQSGDSCPLNGSDESGCPSGALDLTLGGAPLGLGTYNLNALGSVELQNLSTLPSASPYALNATYAGDNSFNGSSAGESITISQAPTTAAIGAITGPIIPGLPVNVPVAINTQSTGISPSGTITLYSGNTQIGTSTISSSSSNGPFVVGGGEITTSQLMTGPNSLTVKYSGDSNYLGSTSASVVVSALVGTSSAVLSSNSTIVLGQSATFTGTVTAFVTGTPPAPSGTITFYSGATQLGAATLVGNLTSAGSVSSSASLTTSQLSLGQDSITVKYGGDSNYSSSSSAAITEMVNPAPTFGVTANPTAIDITAPGQTGSTLLTFTSQNGLSGTNLTVSATCSSFPSESSCSFSQTSIVSSTTISLTANASTGVMFYVFTTAPSATVPAAKNRPGGLGPLATSYAITIACLLCFGIMALLGFGKKRLRWSTAFAALAFALVIANAGCGGGSSSSGGGSGGGGNPGTPVTQNAPVNVSLTIGGISQTVPNLTVTVQ